MIEAELFDGTVLDFDPATPPEVVQRVVREQTAARQGAIPPRPGVGGNTAPGTPAPPQRGALETAASYATQGIAGLREGASNLLGLPVDALNNLPRAANAIGAPGRAFQEYVADPVLDLIMQGRDGSTRQSRAQQAQNAPPARERFTSNPVMGGDWIERNIFRAGGVVPEAPAPVSAGERFTRRVGQEVGSAAIPVGAAINVGARVGVEGARRMNPVSRMFVEPAAIDPKKFATREFTVAGGAGVGASAANEQFGSVNPKTGTYNPSIADLLGALGGAGAVGVGSQIAKPIGVTISALGNKPKFLDDVVKEATLEEIIRAAGLRSQPGEVVDTAGFANQINQGRRVGETIPGFTETLADRTQNPGLAALERGRATAPGAGGGFLQARDANTRAVAGAMSEVEPQGTPGALRAELEVQREQRLIDAITQRNQAEDAARAAVEPVTPQTTPSQRGSVLRNEIDAAREGRRAQTEDAYAGVAEKQVDPAPLTQSLDDAVKNLTEVERTLIPEGTIARVMRLGKPSEEGPVSTGILDASGTPVTRAPEAPGPVDLKEATDLRSELLRLQRAAAADPNAERGGRNASRVLGQMSETVDSYIMNNLTDAEKQALVGARQARFDEAEAFGRQGDPIAEVLAKREGGVYRVRDDMVGSRLVNPQAMDRLFQEADTPATRRAIRDEVLSKGDTSNPERIDRFMADYTEQIDKLPGLRDELTKAASARRAEARVRGDEETLRRDLGDPQKNDGTSPVGRYLRYGPESYDRAMASALGQAQPAKAIDEILNFAGNKPEAVEGARKAFWRTMEKDARSKGGTTAALDSTQPWSPAGLKTFIDDPENAAVMERLYRDNPDHLKRIREIAEAVQGTSVSERARPRNSSGTAQELNNSNLPSAETIASRAFAYQRGQVGLPFLTLNIAGVMARKATRRGQMEAINQLLDKALLDPDVALALAKDYNPANRAALARKTKTWLPGQAATLLDMLDEDPDAETKDAITRPSNDPLVIDVRPNNAR
jgi:hypothetical protein